LSVLTEKRAVEVISGWALIDSIFLYENNGWDLVKGMKWDKVFICEPYTPEVNGRPEKLVTDDLRWLGRKDLFRKHEVLQNMDLLGTDAPEEIPPLYSATTPQDGNKAIDIIKPWKDCLKVGICYGFSGPNHFRKNWGTEKYLELANKLQDKGYAVFIIGGENEKKEMDMFKDIKIGRTVIGEPLAVSSCLISFMNLFISNDCGPMHIASVFKTPQIAIFGPTWQTKNRPWTKADNSYVFQSSMPCSPCYFKPEYSSCTTKECMDRVKVDDVFNMAEVFLGKG
jgi:ADP-heptose:LPS heptosyltransferase